jgi:uncharacterized protein YjbI with pentapeptide repeats
VIALVLLLAALISARTYPNPQGQGKSERRAKSPVARTAQTPEGAPRKTATVGQCPVTPTGKNYSGQNLTNHNFSADPPGSLIGANFESATLKGAIFTGQDLTGASFKSADLGPSEKGPVNFINTTLDKTCFINATMNATNFTFAKIKCADFSNTSLMQAVFGPRQKIQPGVNCRTNFTAATIDVRAITTDHWKDINFTSANFQNLSSPSTFSLKGVDISHAMLSKTNFSAIDMTGANLTNVEFNEAVLLKVKLDNAAMNGVKLRNAYLVSASLKCARFYGTPSDDKNNPNRNICTGTPNSSDPLQPADLTQAVFLNADLSNATLNFARLAGANMSGATLQRASFIGAWLEPEKSISAATVLGADLTGTSFGTAHINSVRFNNVNLTGANFDNTTLEGTDFSGSIMPDVSFTGSVLENVSFNSTLLQQAKFINTTMKTRPGGGSGVIFTCSQLGGANFKDATITAADFTAAVMPPDHACCPQIVGPSWCGMINITQQIYGPVTYPVLISKITCPNGDVAACSGTQWILPNWQTNLCNTNGTVQTMWRKPDCGSAPSEVVKFGDENLKECILASLPGHPPEVTISTAAQIRDITCPGRAVKDLTGLEMFTSLVTLDLSSNQLEQFKLKLGQLKTLKLSNNKLNLLDLTGTPNLIMLEASNNELTSVPVSANTYFVVIDLSHNKLSKFDLAIHNNLSFANLSYNNLTDILNTFNPNLGQLKRLAYLDLSHNSLTQIGSVKAIAYKPDRFSPTGTLQDLRLSCNPSFDCKSLDLTGLYPALQGSQCADFNALSNQWIVRSNPAACPIGLAPQKLAALFALDPAWWPVEWTEARLALWGE